MPNSTALHVVCLNKRELSELTAVHSARSPGLGEGGQTCAGRAQVLTLQPAEEIVCLEDRLGSQCAHQDGLTAQEVVHGAGIEHPI